MQHNNTNNTNNIKNNNDVISYDNLVLINSFETTYASWMRNMIILVGAGITLYSFSNKSEYNALVSFFLIINGIILGCYQLYYYIKKTRACLNNNQEELQNIYKNKTSHNVYILITLSYVCVLIYIIYRYNRIL